MDDPIKLTVHSDPTFHCDRKVLCSIISKVEEALNKMDLNDEISGPKVQVTYSGATATDVSMPSDSTHIIQTMSKYK